MNNLEGMSQYYTDPFEIVHNNRFIQNFDPFKRVKNNRAITKKR